MSQYNILEEKNEYDDNLLDIFGNSFKFEHQKGISEWLKNSADAYKRDKVSEKDQAIILSFNDFDKKTINFSCIDFVGMTENDINKFKRWGDPNAATRGKKGSSFYGGHGNGGKFYMRQMFERSYFVTYRDGILNIYGFNERKKYGYLKDYQNIKVSPREALKIAHIDYGIIPGEIFKSILSGEKGFTVLNGFQPKEVKGEIKIDKLLQKINNHPQARSVLERSKISVFYNNQLIEERLVSQKIKPLEQFSEDRKVLIPQKIRTGDKLIVTHNDDFPQGYLTLKTSETAFSSYTALEELNRIDFISNKIGVIASYKLSELGVKTFPQASFIYGECFLPILENPNEDMVSNDRTKLNESILTTTVLNWVSEQIDLLAQEILKKEQKDRKKVKAEMSSKLNEYLNKWKDDSNIMKKVFSEVFSSSDKGRISSVKKPRKKENLEFINGLSFSYSYANLPINEEYNLTLKANVNDIPIGVAISISSDNNHVDIIEKEIIIKNDYVKKTENGDSIAVINVKVIGNKLEERGVITAIAGKFKTEIGFSVVENHEAENKSSKSDVKILLSGMDNDPLGIASEGKLFLNSREPLIYQRPRDFDEGIYWINTQSYLPESILDKLGEGSLVWRNYLIQRYVEVFLKEAIYKLQKNNPDSFDAEKVDNEIFGKYSTNLYEKITKDLDRFLLEEYYDPSSNLKK